MRIFTAALFVTFVGLLPVHAQDRTPPAGSLRALQVPADLPAPVVVAPLEGRQGLAEGRSADERVVSRKHRHVVH